MAHHHWNYRKSKHNLLGVIPHQINESWKLLKSVLANSSDLKIGMIPDPSLHMQRGDPTDPQILFFAIYQLFWYLQ